MKRLVLVALGAAVLSACGREERPAAPNAQAGAAGSTSGGSGGVAGDGLRAVASVLDGYVLKQPCLSESGPRACRTHAPGACPVSQDPAFAGSTPTRDTLSFGGQSGTLYDVTLHVQGIVEPKIYRGGNDASDLATNGFLTAGTVDNVRNQHSAYALRVTVPTGTYFFNSLGRENVRHSVFPVDFEATVTIQGATPIELWISDPNCEALRNCGDPDVPTECTPVALPSLEPKIRESLGTEASAYDGQFLGFVVRNVTQRN
jgi:hypothetical protein